MKVNLENDSYNLYPCIQGYINWLLQQSQWVKIRNTTPLSRNQSAPLNRLNLSQNHCGCRRNFHLQRNNGQHYCGKQYNQIQFLLYLCKESHHKRQNCFLWHPSKVGSQGKIPNWLVKEYAEQLAFPVCKIINTSFQEQRLPNIWKFANASPLPKVTPVEDLKETSPTNFPNSLPIKSAGRMRCSWLLLSCCSMSNMPPKALCCSHM